MIDNHTGQQRTILYSCELFEIASISWSNLSPLNYHSHGWSHCQILIQEGEFENALDFGFKKETQSYKAGDCFSTPIGAMHTINCLTSTGKTLHVYSPKLAIERPNLQFSSANFKDNNNFKAQIALSSSTTLSELQNLFQVIQRQSVSTYSPYFMNQLFSGVSAQMLMAEELAVRTKSTLATYEASPLFTTIENEVISSLVALIGWKEGQGIGVPGGSAANFMAIHCARQRMFPQAKLEGCDGRKLVVFVSQDAHYSFKKACAALGIGTNQVISVKADEQGKMIPKELEISIKTKISEGKIPLLVAATAGTTVTGAFDSIVEIYKICRGHQLWLHIDGAWGGPAMFSDKLKHLVSGMELSDSFTFDAHKLIGANLTSSFFLTKHQNILVEANDVSGGEYLFHFDDLSQDLGKKSWQCGRKADALSFWAIWKSLGTQGIGLFIDRLLDLKNEILAWIATQPRLELVANPEYLNICVRIHPADNLKNPDWSKVVREKLIHKNLAFVNYSSDSQGSFLRLILANPFLEFTQVREILEWALQEN